METTASIRKINHLENDEAEKIWHVFQRSYRIEADLIGATNFPPLNRTAGDIQSSKTEFFGFQKENAVAGVIEIDHHTHVLDICSLVVDPDHFRLGIGSQLMDYVLGLFDPVHSIVETALVNRPAISLYEAKGYVEEKRWMTSFKIEKIKLQRVSLS